MLATPLIDVLPAFAAELEHALRAVSEHELADQVASLMIESLCGCNDEFCSSFYTGAQPEGPWGPSLRNVTPPVATGMVILDVVDDRIRYVEVLHRSDVKARFSQGSGRSFGRSRPESGVTHRSDLRERGGRGGT